MKNYSETAYKDKLESIFKRFPSVQKVPFGDAYKPGLDNMIKFAHLLGDPQEKYRTIHVAGTNGKGSVANMLASALSSIGLKVGLYTSPHIIDFRERARVLGPTTGQSPSSIYPDRVRSAARRGLCPSSYLGEELSLMPILVPEEYVYDFLCRYETDMDALDLSFFEITTGLAFKWFADEEVDVAVIETGLGGRLDSTNIITPDLSIVTSIALDHCALLGNTLEAIAFEKAGIFKPGVPAVVGEYLPETRAVFERAATKNGSPLTFAEDAEPSMSDLIPGILSEMDLRGKYQEKNLRTVLAAIDVLSRNQFYSRLFEREVVADAICHTASRAGFHGRWEMVRKNPLVIADLGHNPAALKENFSQLEDMMSSGDYSSLIIIYAVMADKDLDGIMPLMPDNATYVLTTLQSSRALPEEDLASRLEAFMEDAGRSIKIVETASVEDAVSVALSLDNKRNPLIFIGGSTYLLSEALSVLGTQGF
jgi:dihydrofolate synthase/folylpolyglutamate synthase